MSQERKFYDGQTVEPGRWYWIENTNRRFPWEAKGYWYMLDADGKDNMATPWDKKRIQKRAERNREDCRTKKGFLAWPFALFLIALIAILSGCVTETAKITEYDPQTKAIIKVTETSQRDAIDKIMNEMEKKNVVIWKQGWFFTGEVTVTGTETYMPCLKLSGGKVNSGHLSIKDSPEQIPAIIRAIQQPVTVSATNNGIEIKESTVEPANQ